MIKGIGDNDHRRTFTDPVSSVKAPGLLNYYVEE